MIASTQRSSPAFAIGGVPHAFACITCGASVATTHFLRERGICHEHCFEHEFEYDRDERQWLCIVCSEFAPADWYDVD
jgi:hypothetical protein